MPLVDRLAEFFLGRLAEARQFRHAARDAGLMKLRDRADLQLFVERLDLLRPEPWQREKLENVRRKFRAQVVEKFERTGFDQLLDFRRDGFADAGNLLERFFIPEVGHVATPGLEGTRGIRVSADLEGIFALQLEQRRDLFEHIRDRRLVHQATFSRNCSGGL